MQMEILSVHVNQALQNIQLAKQHQKNLHWALSQSQQQLAQEKQHRQRCLDALNLSQSTLLIAQSQIKSVHCKEMIDHINRHPKSDIELELLALKKDLCMLIQAQVSANVELATTLKESENLRDELSELKLEMLLLKQGQIKLQAAQLQEYNIDELDKAENSLKTVTRLMNWSGDDNEAGDDKGKDAFEDDIKVLFSAIQGAEAENQQVLKSISKKLSAYATENDSREVCIAEKIANKVVEELNRLRLLQTTSPESAMSATETPPFNSDKASQASTNLKSPDSEYNEQDEERDVVNDDDIVSPIKPTNLLTPELEHVGDFPVISDKPFEIIRINCLSSSGPFSVQLINQHGDEMQNGLLVSVNAKAGLSCTQVRALLTGNGEGNLARLTLMMDGIIVNKLVRKCLPNDAAWV